MKQSQRIVKNAVFGIGASLIGGLVYLATVLTIARMVSVVEFGKYSFVLAFAMFFQLLADAGLPRMMIREIAKDPECTRAAGWCRGVAYLGCIGGGVSSDRANRSIPAFWHGCKDRRPGYEHGNDGDLPLRRI